MGYVVKMTNRKFKHKPPIFLASVPTDEENTFDNTLFETIEEATPYAFATAEIAALIIGGLPGPTKNIDYEVVKVAD